MEDSLCKNGIAMLQSIGLNPIIDTDLQIAFNDQLNLCADLCKIQNRCALQGKCWFYTNFSLTLYIDGKPMGPLTSLKVQDIKALAEPSPLGVGSNVGSDANARQALEIKADRINLEVNYPSEIMKLSPMGSRVDPRLNKLVIYEKDGLFIEHDDKMRGDNHIGTMILPLPVPYDGGALILYDEQNELRIPFDELIKDRVPWIAFYTDVKYKVEVANSGIRMALLYDLVVAEPQNNNENELYWKTHVSRYTCDPEIKYYFQGYNQEVLSTIKSKLNKIFSKEMNPIKEEDKEEKDFEEEEMWWDKVKKEFAKPDGVAIMLKRRYGAVSVSVDMLKGSDSALYHALKDDFIVEAKVILLEQKSDQSNYYDDKPIEVVAASQMVAQKDQYQSDEENEQRENKKYVPRKVQEIGKSNLSEKHDKKKVCLVSGYAPQEISKIVNRDFVEISGDETIPAEYTYMHSALFIYPK